jgi:hypothetical protein
MGLRILPQTIPSGDRIFPSQFISDLICVPTEIFSSNTYQQPTVSLLRSKVLHIANDNEYSTGEKPIKCPYCSDKFADPARRHKHVARVHSDKPTKRRRRAPFVLGSNKATHPGET